MYTGQKLETGSTFDTSSSSGLAGTPRIRDTFGRTLDQAQHEDQRWREAEIRRAEETAHRVRRLEGRVGLSAAAVGVGLIVLGVVSSQYFLHATLDPQRIATVTGIFLGSAAVCLLAALLLALAQKYRASLRRHLRHYGVAQVEPLKRARKLTVRRRSIR